jgi:thioredoxin 1
VSLEHFKESSFEQDVLSSDLPAVVDFTATWCGPCKQLAPVVEELAGTYAGKVKIGKLDVDESPGVAMKYGVRSVPTLLFFKGGEVVEEVRGAVGREVLENKLRSAFALSA